MATPDLSVIIGTYNQRDSLKLALESLFEQTLSPDLYEIIVVDSSSTDGTKEMVLELNPDKHLDLNYIRQPNLGRPGARNRGIKEAKGKILLFTDADMIAHHALLENHWVYHQEHPGNCLEGVTYNLKDIKAGFKSENLDPYIKANFKKHQKLNFAFFLSGNLSAPKDVIVKAGGYDQDFSGYGWEDIELGYRLSKMRVPLLFLPEAKNYHYHALEEQRSLDRKYKMGISASLFYKKHPNFTIKMFLGMNPLAMGIYRLMKISPKFKNWLENKSRYFAEEFQYRDGLVDGLKNKTEGKNP